MTTATRQLTTIECGNVPALFKIEEYRSRVDRFKEGLRQRGIDVLWITMPEHLNYLTAFDPMGVYLYSAGVLAADEGDPYVITHKCEKELAAEQCWIPEVFVWEHGDDPIAMTVELLHLAGVRNGSVVGVEKESWYLNVAQYEQLRRALPGVQFVDASNIGQEVRMVKSPGEIDLLRQAARYADIGFAAAVEHLNRGISEHELSARVLAAMAEAGSEYPALPMIVGSGERSRLFHAVPSERRIDRGDPVMLEITGVSRRYNSNIVRTVVAGQASSELKHLWEIVSESFWQPFELVKPGTPVAELDRLSREIRSDYARYIPARVGFGMGLAYPPVWLGKPDLLIGDSHVLEPGMVFSMEPSIAQHEGKSVIFGYNVVVTEDGAEILHKTPRDLFEILD